MITTRRRARRRPTRSGRATGKDIISASALDMQSREATAKSVNKSLLIKDTDTIPIYV